MPPHVIMELIVGEFIKLEINLNKCVGTEKCGKCIQVCPVNIFSSNSNYPKIVEANEDECTLCDLCLKNCEAEAITMHRLYEE